MYMTKYECNYSLILDVLITEFEFGVLSSAIYAYGYRRAQSFSMGCAVKRIGRFHLNGDLHPTHPQIKKIECKISY